MTQELYRQHKKTYHPSKHSKNRSKIAITIFILIISLTGGIAVYHFSRNEIKIPILHSKIKVYIDQSLIQTHYNNLKEYVEKQDKKYEITDDSSLADILVTTQKIDERCKPFYEIDFLPVQRFATLNESVSNSQIKSIILGKEKNYEYINIKGFEEVTNKIFGVGQNDEKIVVDNKDDLKSALDQTSKRIALIPFSWLDPTMKVLKIEDNSPLDTPTPFRFVEYLCAKEEDIRDFIENTNKMEYHDTIDYTKVATVIQTGVTAMGRNVYIKMIAEKDPAYISYKISPLLRGADLTHTSNEVSFSKDCTQTANTMRFCAKPEFIETLKACGIDLVELTGNHNNDWGHEANLYTLNLYKENGIAYFGGGVNLEEAKKPFITDIKGTKIAFLGYNWYDAVGGGNPSALATATLPGANPYDEQAIKEDIQKLRKEVDIIIVDIQFQECWAYSENNTICYRADAVNYQQDVFRKIKDFGADIVVGTQAHQPQGFEIRKDGIIFYGLGNLFFDQIVYTGTREELILKHYFYKGKYINTTIYTAFYDSDYQPYITRGEERKGLLQKLFKASGWNITE